MTRSSATTGSVASCDRSAGAERALAGPTTAQLAISSGVRRRSTSASLTLSPQSDLRPKPYGQAISLSVAAISLGAGGAGRERWPAV